MGTNGIPANYPSQKKDIRKVTWKMNCSYCRNFVEHLCLAALPIKPFIFSQYVIIIYIILKPIHAKMWTYHSNLHFH